MASCRLLADESFNHRIVRGLLRRLPEVDVVSVQDAGLSGAPDAEVLAWSALELRVVLTYDVATMSRDAIERIENGLPMPGVIECPRSVPIGVAIDDLVLIVECSLDGEWQNSIIYLPL